MSHTQSALLSWYYSVKIVRMENTDVQFVEFVVRAIVNNPDDVKVTRTVDERGVLITLDINPGDMGYVIGRQGQTARSIRTLLKIVGAKNNARVNLKINEPIGGRGPGAGSMMRQPTTLGSPMGMPMAAPSAPIQNREDIDISAVDLSSVDSLNI